MKFKNLTKITALVLLIVSIFVLNIFSATAVEDESSEPIASSDVTPTETQTVATTEATEAVTTPPVTQNVTEASTTEPTEKKTKPSTEKTETTVATYATESLPEVTFVETVTAVVVEESEREESGDLTYGIVSWACVIVGVLVVVVILISNKTHRIGRNGKQRYDEGDKITGQKRLLNDDYYNNRKYNSYYNKDTRK